MTRILCAGLAAATAVTGLTACSSMGSGQADASGPPEAGHASVGAPVDAGAGDATAGACLTPQDCPMHLGAQVYCCTENTCGVDIPNACADGSGRPIQASDYDRTCATDMDCVAIGEGNACSIISPCATAAINKGALARYQSDIAQTPCFGLSSCVFAVGPCCRRGSCQWNTACGSAADTLPACAEAGGACSVFITQCGSKGAGPPDSCAYPDEMCCLQ